jgi:hypothetical protein
LLVCASEDFFGNIEAVRLPFLVARRLLRVRGQPIGFDALDGQPRDVFEGQVQYGMFGDRCVAIADDPFLVEGGGFGVRQFIGNSAEGLRRARGLGEGDGDRLRAQAARAEQIDLALMASVVIALRIPEGIALSIPEGIALRIA